MPLEVIITAAKTVSRASDSAFAPPDDHQRDDQRDLDHGHRDREHQRPERLPQPVRDHLGVLHGGQHRAGQHQRDHRPPAPGPGAVPRSPRAGPPGDHRDGHGPGVRASRDGDGRHAVTLSDRPDRAPGPAGRGPAPGRGARAPRRRRGAGPAPRPVPAGCPRAGRRARAGAATAPGAAAATAPGRAGPHGYGG